MLLAPLLDCYKGTPQGQRSKATPSRRCPHVPRAGEARPSRGLRPEEGSVESCWPSYPLCTRVSAVSPRGKPALVGHRHMDRTPDGDSLFSLQSLMRTWWRKEHPTRYGERLVFPACLKIQHGRILHGPHSGARISTQSLHFHTELVSDGLAAGSAVQGSAPGQEGPH